MGIISFFKEAGEKLFGTRTPKRPPQQAQAAPDNAALQAQAAQANQAAAERDRDLHRHPEPQRRRLERRVRRRERQRHRVGRGGRPGHQGKNRAVLRQRHRRGPGQRPADGERAGRRIAYYTVVRGDTLSAIAKKHYGNANAYPKIFEANKPMLTHPDKIYPGQLLRIPPA